MVFYSNIINYEKGLVLLKNHTVLYDLLLIEIIPSSVGTLLAIMTVFQNPAKILIVFDSALHF